MNEQDAEPPRLSSFIRFVTSTQMKMQTPKSKISSRRPVAVLGARDMRHVAWGTENNLLSYLIYLLSTHRSNKRRRQALQTTQSTHDGSDS
jgi:hypothetical protein